MCYMQNRLKWSHQHSENKSLQNKKIFLQQRPQQLSGSICTYHLMARVQVPITTPTPFSIFILEIADIFVQYGCEKNKREAGNGPCQINCFTAFLPPGGDENEIATIIASELSSSSSSSTSFDNTTTLANGMGTLSHAPTFWLTSIKIYQPWRFND